MWKAVHEHQWLTGNVYDWKSNLQTSMIDEQFVTVKVNVYGVTSSLQHINYWVTMCMTWHTFCKRQWLLMYTVCQAVCRHQWLTSSLKPSKSMCTVCQAVCRHQWLTSSLLTSMTINVYAVSSSLQILMTEFQFVRYDK